MKRLLITTLILGLFTFALTGCGNSENPGGGENQASADDLKAMDDLLNGVRTDQYADNSLDQL